MEIHRDIPSSNIPSNYTETNKQTKSEGTLAENAVKDINKQPSVSQTAHNVSHSVDYRGETPSKTIVQMVHSVEENREGAVSKQIGEGPRVSPGHFEGVNYGAKAKETDRKVQSTYQKMVFSKDFKTMSIVKTKIIGGKEEKVEKTYKLQGKIGDGSSGDVYSYEPLSEDGKTKVVKIAKTGMSIEDIKQGHKILEEQHVNPKTGEQLYKVTGIVKRNKFLDELHGRALQPDYVGGDLENESVSGNLSASEYMNAASQLLFGLNHLHTETGRKRGRAHRDIKPNNILFRINKDGKNSYAIADLDGAHPLSGSSGKVIKTHGFMSPQDHELEAENLFGSEKDRSDFYQRVDVYAMGMSFIELLTDLESFDDDYNHAGPLEYGQIRFKNDIEPAPNSNEEKQLKGLVKLINEMTSYEWEDRPSAAEALTQLQDLGIKIPEYPT